MNIMKRLVCSISFLIVSGNVSAEQWEKSKGCCKHIGENKSDVCTIITSANATSATMQITIDNKTIFKIYESDTSNRINDSKAIRSEEGEYTCFSDANNPTQNICFKLDMPYRPIDEIFD